MTLQRLMPNAASVFQQLLTTLEIQEPCFTDLVILYRKSKQVLERPSSEKDPLPKYSQASISRHNPLFLAGARTTVTLHGHP